MFDLLNIFYVYLRCSEGGKNLMLKEYYNKILVQLIRIIFFILLFISI